MSVIYSLFFFFNELFLRSYFQESHKRKGLLDWKRKGEKDQSKISEAKLCGSCV